MPFQRFIMLMFISGLASESANAGSLAWIIDEDSSTVTAQYETSIETSGTLIGDWDSETNPEGTQTRPGLWGGSGNNPIGLSLDQLNTGGGAFQPVGAFGLSIDTDLELVAIDGLVLEMAEGGSIPFDSSIVMLYETFRSITPDSLFFGGFEVPLPLGSGELTSWSFTMEGTSTGLLVESGEAGTWLFAIPAMLVVTASGNVLGVPVELPPTSLPVLINGSYVDTGDEHLVLLDFNEQLGDVQVFDPPLELPDVPLELPTIIPPGSTAGVILSMVTDSGSFLIGVDAQVTARPDVQAVPGDVTGDGHVNVDDLLAVISSWGYCPECPADFDGDGFVGVNELLFVLQYWGN